MSSFKRKFLYIGVALATICVLAAVILLGPGTELPPNVVLIVVDTLRADHLTCYGYAKDTSPFISELASQGLLFERAYSASSWTSPASASIHTSVYPFQHGVVTGFLATKKGQKIDSTITLNKIPEEAHTIAEALKAAGYATFAVTDNLNITEEQGFHQGFDAFQNYNYETAEAVNRKLAEWHKDMENARPYFLYVHYNDPHQPYHRRKPWFGEEGSRAITRVTAYDSEIGYVDSKIREIFNLFGWDENTVLILTSDHGEEFYEHGELGHGKNLYSETTHVPLLVYPSVESPPDSRIGIPVSNIDIFPTILDVAGLPPAANCEGISLIRMVREEGELSDGRFLISHLMRRWNGTRPESTIKSVVFGDWKYIVTAPNAGELYNLMDDPGEQENLLDQRESTAAPMRGYLEEFEKTCSRFTQVNLDVTVDEKQLKKLESLGYVK